MSNIDKQAVQAVADLKAGYTLGHADVEIIQQMALDAVTLLDELEPMALAHLNLNLLCEVYRSAYEEARHDGLVNWETATSLAEENSDLKRKLEAAEKTSAARLGAIDTTHKMFRRERARAEVAEKRIAELEAREVTLRDINDFIADVKEPTLANALNQLAKGVRAADISAIQRAGINIAAAGKGEAS